MNRIELFNHALASTRELQIRFPQADELQSIIEQLEYLIALEMGSIADLRLLGRVNFGVIAAKSVDDMDEVIGELLHQASAEAKQMQAERLGRAANGVG